ncbi:MAG: hypothetical protein ACLPX5_00210 [Dissulfurispiraceae bacterium]
MGHAGRASYKFLEVAMVAVSFITRETQLVMAVSSTVFLGLRALVS